ncbi:MAG: response regulator transcription factor [Bacteroidales bacterium]|jgi:DNA-binding NarL/FixJ family response regulator|nr:response regulator transcription factor [Bacteroidales bacterium]MDD4087493.1 response regulator transcription factor [Bacteroidales bacterium]MDY0086730.1 response regulator transcription factor [Bacteroidales bacterium]
MKSKPIRVLIVDDHQLMVEGLKSLLEDEDDIAFVAGANSMAETLNFLQNNEIDVILMDVNMPDASGIETTEKVKAGFPEIKVVALTMHEDIAVITKMIKAGASGYILKRTNMNEVVEAIRVVYNNGRYLSNVTQKIIMDNLGTAAGQDELMEDSKPILSSRELEVLNLIAREYNNAQIAEQLFISERTVEAHRRNIFIKTETKSIVGLIKYAINKGLIDA